MVHPVTGIGGPAERASLSEGARVIPTAVWPHGRSVPVVGCWSITPLEPGGSALPIKPAPAVLRAMDVLECLAASGSHAPTMSEIARRTGQSKATCHSVLLALAKGGYVRRDPASLAYSLGPGLISLGALASSNLRLSEVARQEMEALSQSLGVTTAAAIVAGTHLVVIAGVGPPQPFYASLPVGQRVPFAPPLGAAFIAWSPDPEIEEWLDRAPRRLSDGERQHFLAALAAVREHGYSVTLNDQANRQFAEAVEQVAIHPESQKRRRAGTRRSATSGRPTFLRLSRRVVPTDSRRFRPRSSATMAPWPWWSSASPSASRSRRSRSPPTASGCVKPPTG